MNEVRQFKIMMKRLLYLFGCSLATLTSLAQLPGGTQLLPGGLASLTSFGPGTPTTVREEVSVTGQPFTKALLINTFKKQVANGDYGLSASINTPLKKGDVLWISFIARSLESKRETGESFVELRFDQLVNGKYTWPSYLERGISIGPDWTQTSIPFVLTKDVQPEDVKFVLKFDTYPQRFELGPVSFINYGADVSLDILPRSVVRYGGDEPSAPWRKAAVDRIEKFRKGDLSIKVVDGKGAPVSGADVTVHMTRNAFSFGTATNSAMLLDTGAAAKIYRDTLTKYFNQVVFENEIKSKNWERFNYAQTAKGVAWLKAHNIPVRGHVMVWPSWQHAGAAFAVYKKDTTGLRAAILKRIDEQTTTLKGFFTEWDVVNEPFAHDDFLKLLGREAMVDWFKAARKGTKGIKLFLNDYTMFHGEGPASPSEKFYDNIKFLLDNGAPIEAIGEQGHIGGTPPSISKVLERLDHFATLGLPIQISEFDINSNDDEFKARYLGDFLTAVYSHPSTIGFLQWGFWEGAHWFPVAALWDKNWKPRAHGKVFAQLVTKTWATNVKGTTNKDGVYKVRGFTGEYELMVTKGPKVISKQTTLSNSGQTISIKL